ncbi:MAG: hypothetical protein LC793_10460 [Thermomicrobia bacterium]|nr:hypothetical protein [Thermomicrobia bacterium]
MGSTVRGIIIGACLGGGFTLASAIVQIIAAERRENRNRQHQEKQRLNDKRIEAYAELMAAVWLIPADGEGDDRVIDRAKTRIRFANALGVVRLVASTPVFETALSLGMAVKAYANAPDVEGESDHRAEALVAFNAAASRELGVK